MNTISLYIHHRDTEAQSYHPRQKKLCVSETLW